jgi:hypothetical protein
VCISHFFPVWFRVFQWENRFIGQDQSPSPPFPPSQALAGLRVNFYSSLKALFKPPSVGPGFSHLPTPIPPSVPAPNIRANWGCLYPALIPTTKPGNFLQHCSPAQGGGLESKRGVGVGVGLGQDQDWGGAWGVGPPGGSPGPDPQPQGGCGYGQ